MHYGKSHRWFRYGLNLGLKVLGLESLVLLITIADTEQVQLLREGLSM